MTNTLPLTVLAHEGPQVRAYLGRMRQAGWRPERVLLMVQSHHPTTKRPIGRWLPRSWRLRYAERAQEVIQNHWPRRIRVSHPHLVECMIEELSRIHDSAASLVAEMLGRFRYEDYAEQVERVLVKDLRDPVLSDKLSRTGPAAVLFTGGGILRDNLLGLPDIRFLHIHPGYLPYVRGADGLLWSLLVRGCPGVSAFYMERGIDTGEIIVAEEFPPLSFDLADRPRPDDSTLYRAIFSFCDPFLRAELLVTQVLQKGEDLCRLATTRQNAGADAGITYHFLHPTLRRRALELLFRNGERTPEDSSLESMGETSRQPANR